MTEQQQMELQKHSDTLKEHSLMLNSIDQSILALSDNIKDLVANVREITITINDIKLINLRIANVEKDTKDTFKRAFREIDKIKEDCNECPGYRKAVDTLNEESKLGVRPLTLKNLLIYGVIAIISYGSYLTVSLQEIKEHSNLLDNKELLLIDRVTKMVEKITKVNIIRGVKDGSGRVN